MTYFKSIQIFLTPLTIKTESQFIDILLEMGKFLMLLRSNASSSKKKSLSEVLFTQGTENIKVLIIFVNYNLKLLDFIKTRDFGILF